MKSHRPASGLHGGVLSMATVIEERRRDGTPGKTEDGEAVVSALAQHTARSGSTGQGRASHTKHFKKDA